MGTVKRICRENVAIRRSPRNCRSMGPITDPVRNVTKGYETHDGLMRTQRGPAQSPRSSTAPRRRSELVAAQLVAICGTHFPTTRGDRPRTRLREGPRCRAAVAGEKILPLDRGDRIGCADRLELLSLHLQRTSWSGERGPIITRRPVTSIGCKDLHTRGTNAGDRDDQPESSRTDHRLLRRGQIMMPRGN
jgi:hypothetical protein